MIDLGVGETDISISMDSIYAENRKLIDPEANRYFFVWTPENLEIEGDVPALARAPLHPTIDRGFREIPAGNNISICRSDLEGLKPGDRIRLKDLCNVEIIAMDPAKARFEGKAVGKKMKIIHWAPPNGLAIKVMKPDGVDEGVGEAGIARELNRVVQFERYGFVRINRLGTPILAYFAHR
jgi:glutamyl-tRNA synthetase